MKEENFPEQSFLQDYSGVLLILQKYGLFFQVETAIFVWQH